MPQRYTAYEIRWFGDGEFPADVEAQLENIEGHDKNVKREIRTDVYFRVDGQDSIGIKLRSEDAAEGKGLLEIKMRTDIPEENLTAGSAVGCAEEWRKIGWEFPKADQATLKQLLDRGYGVRKVHVWKDRKQWKFEPYKGMPPRAIRDRKDRACMVEQTVMKIFVNPADESAAALLWSVAVEAFDDKENKRFETLRQGFSELFSEYKGNRLTPEISFGYPKQLLLSVGKMEGAAGD